MMDNQATVGVTGLTGNFVGLGGVPVTIQDLSDQWVDTEFHPANPFVTFQSAPQLPQLLIDIIYRGINSPAECATSPAAAGQVCGLRNSPFDFQNTSGGGSRVGFVFGGKTDDGLSAWVGNFTSQFSAPYQSVLADLTSQGLVTNTYSATFAVTPVAEPRTVALGVAGLAFLLIGSHRFKRATPPGACG